MAPQGGRKTPSLLAPPRERRGHDVRLCSQDDSYGWSFGKEFDFDPISFVLPNFPFKMATNNAIL